MMSIEIYIGMIERQAHGEKWVIELMKEGLPGLGGAYGVLAEADGGAAGAEGKKRKFVGKKQYFIGRQGE